MADLEVVTGHFKWCGMQSHPPQAIRDLKSLTHLQTLTQWHLSLKLNLALGKFVNPLKTTPVTDNRVLVVKHMKAWSFETLTYRRKCDQVCP